MSLNFCDLLVLGSDLSGVIAGTLLAKRGMNVLILDNDDEEERSSNLVTGLDSRAFKGLLSKLTIPESKVQIAELNEVTCQLILPKHRIDLSPSWPHFEKEIGREFPEERELVTELKNEIEDSREQLLDPLFSLLPICSRKELKVFHRWLRQPTHERILALWDRLSPTLKTLFKLKLQFLSRASLIEPLTLQLMLYLAPENSTTFSVRGGIHGLKRLFYEKLEYFGGMVHPLAGDEIEIGAHGREVRSVKLGRYSFPTRCRFLLGNMNFKEFYDKLPRNLWSFLSKRRMRKVGTAAGEYLLQFHVDRDVLPGPMKQNVILVEDPARPLEGLNYIELNLSPLPRGEEKKLLLTVSYRHTHSSPPDPIFFEGLHREIEKRLRKLIPFANGSLARVFPQNDLTETLFPESVDFPLFSKLAQKRQIYPPSYSFPSLVTPFKNTFLLGPNLLDWLGMEGKILAALRGVEMTWGEESKTKKG